MPIDTTCNCGCGDDVFDTRPAMGRALDQLAREFESAIELRPHGADMTVHIAGNGRQIGLILRQFGRAAWKLSKGLAEATGYPYEHASPGDFKPILAAALDNGAFAPSDWERRMAGRTMSGMASGMES